MAKPTPEEFAGWPRPHEVLRQLTEAFGSEDVAKQLVFDRVAADLLALFADTATKDRGGHYAQERRIIARVIPDEWSAKRRSIDEIFWQVGNLTFVFGDSPYAMDQPTHVRYFGVRFDPDGLSGLLATAPPKPTPATSDQKPAVVEEQPKTAPTSPVAAAHLQTWFEAFEKIYGGTATDTEDMALTLAKAMFPDKHVTRDAIRKLRGAQKRGRKPAGG